MIEKYAAFAGEVCYPAGGFDDLVAVGDDLSEMQQQAIASSVGGYGTVPDWAHVIDLSTMQRVCYLKGEAWISDTTPPTNSWSYDRD